MADEAESQPSREQPDSAPAPPVDGQEQLTVAVSSGDVVSQAGGDEAAVDGRPALPFPVVGIGASAGGIEAYLELLEKIPADTGMAYVVVSHLAPDLKSHLPEILGRQTSLPVSTIEAGAALQPNCVYVAPPRARISLKNGVFQIEGHPSDPLLRPIDSFFHSLASCQKNRAVGVILSGMDADGALGLKAIKAEGGITMVQSPESAKFPTMPRSSILADHVDIIARPGEIGLELARLGQQFGNPELRRLEEPTPDVTYEQQYHRILILLRSVGGIDFRLYKPTTISRRVARRMLMQHIETMADYVSLLQSNPKELRELHEDALINVTRFFRDPDVFETLKTTVLPRLFENRDMGQQVRIWVAGCSSGEEVYSIAICVLEYLSRNPAEPFIQLFGTDASEENIHKARVGLYPETITEEVSPERLRRFFTKTEKGYQISKRVRDLCIFARQNLCYDPPFSRMDLISCRNVLIYFGGELQKQIIPTFHYALRPGGFLLLGSSETIREFTDLFGVVDRKQKIYSRLGRTSSRRFLDTLRPAIVPVELLGATGAELGKPVESWTDTELQSAADRIILARYGPPGVVVNDRLEIVQSRGQTSPFLEMPQGLASLQLDRMTRERIAPQVTAAVRRAIRDELPVMVEGLKVGEGEQGKETDLEVIPIHSLSARAKAYLVLFVPTHHQLESVAGRATDQAAPPVAADEKDRLITQLQADLSSTKPYLQSLLEEREGKNQELVSANEEIQSANEELQSNNEELETTKEELQSSNEELQTVNDELQNRNLVLTQASNDLSNLLNSVNLPVLMLTEDFRIRHFTPPTQRVMSVRAGDVGRPFAEIRMNLEIDDLQPLFKEVLDTLAPREMEVKDREGHWYLLRVRPYRTTDNKIDGLVIVLVDIDQLRRSQQELREARDFAQSIIRGIPLPLAVLDASLKIRSTNEAFCKLAGATDGELEARFLPDLASVLWDLEEPLGSSLNQLRHGKGDEAFLFEHKAGDQVLSIRGRVLKPEGEQFVLMTFEDITPHKEVERLLRQERERLARQVESTTQALGRTREELRALAGSLFNSQEEERSRVARELHDDVSQRLAALEIDSTRIVQDLPSNPSKALENLNAVRTGLSRLSQDVRGMSHRLHPSIIEDLGLAAALKALTDEFGQREQMIVSFSTENVRAELPADLATNLYRIAQEGLRNIAKHAGKTHVKVDLRCGANGIQLQLLDFGAGFDTSATRTGLGLIAMEERARLVGGTLRVESSLGRGTKVLVEAPLQSKD